MTDRYGWRGGCLIVLMILMASCGRGPDTIVDGDMAFVNVSVIPMDSERVLEDQTVVVRQTVGSSRSGRPTKSGQPRGSTWSTRPAST